MKQAKISEIFLSYQGEGTFLGSRQLFVRFYGCNLNCAYCDTVQALGASPQGAEKPKASDTVQRSYKSFSTEELLGKVLDFEDAYNELALTGGEPLLYADFLKGFLPLFKEHGERKIYLETNGSLPDEFDKVSEHIDIVAMDIKLPSSTGQYSEDLWERHERFIKAASRKELVLKTVITDSTVMDDIKKMAGVAGLPGGDFTIVLQPVTPVNDAAGEPDGETLSYFKEYIGRETGKEVRVIGQMHKLIGIR